MKQGTPRTNNGAKYKRGEYVIPAEIRVLKPENTSCTVKRTKNGYCVVERLRVLDPNHLGEMKNASGKTIGCVSFLG